MECKLTCEFESIEFAELAVGELQQWRDSIYGVALSCRNNPGEDHFSQVVYPLAAAGADVNNGLGTGSVSTENGNAVSYIPIIDTQVSDDGAIPEPYVERSCRLKVTCASQSVRSIAAKLRSLGAIHIQWRA